MEDGFKINAGAVGGRDRQKKGKKTSLRASSDRQLLTMCVPAMIKLFIFAYVPMIGIVMAFQDFKPRTHIFSEFVGLDNFRFFFQSDDAARITFNTVFMNIIFIASSLVVALLLALVMNEIRSRFFLKSAQTMMFLPFFISWALAGLILKTMLDPAGLITVLIQDMTGKAINFYSSAGYWRVILPVINIWKGAGVSAIIYYANIIGIDKEYYEAASIDGASRLQCVRHITLPSLKSMIVVMTVMALGNIIRADFGIFYFGTRNSSMLYEVTDVIDTYVYRALMNSYDFSRAAAVGLFQSVVGCILIVTTNLIVRRVNRKAALF